ncbi:deoxyguanosinetriphosphate triphosphohydrolase [Snodgrassella alvi]|uniref:Deoxyguanosinetriphosphate triphosphohydrolase n=1 Tax=Snodgrassella alvi TaxID=1196083 RepID=A0A2N9WWG5_9NEIS|nr:deoxyguanosinetriphosphate triphosphohydrolase [Snodgrassella alvi]PIT17014.1 deoxyguanosinetriphosphate triphosphohydrolase [Snodgrassella alvi]PIT18320.1 deoxyguanosinetriphosphate triphosphohydrolase [Snodgrassella alvi]
MNWTQLLSAQRFKPDNGCIVPTVTASSEEGAEALRTDFHIDYDRVVFSSGFRRLARKTQVHPFALHDHTHNRLTHSVEVASVGRSLGNRVGVMLAAGNFLPPGSHAADIGAIVQVACLAHDFGNPPFGHTGEDALREWFRDPQHAHYLQQLSTAERNDIETYEGNAHSLRLVASLEMYQNDGGMRLTAAVIGALLKYPWTSSAEQGRCKFNIYQTELPFIDCIAQQLGLPQEGENHWVRHPLSYLMEAADDICYALLDLEDAVELGLLQVDEVEQILSRLTNKEYEWHSYASQERCARLRGIAIGRAVDDIAHTFIKYHGDLLNGSFRGKDLLALASPDVNEALHAAKELARTRIFRHQSKLITEIATFPCLGSILGLLVPAVYAFIKTDKLSKRQELALSLLKEQKLSRDDGLYLAYMKVLDFVGGMTDNTAAKLAREVSGIGML